MGLGKVLSAIFMPVGLGGLGVGKSPFSGGSSQGEASAPAPAPIPLPQAPAPEAAQAQATETIKKKKSAMTKSVYTSPLGVAGEADVARKTLLGQ